MPLGPYPGGGRSDVRVGVRWALVSLWLLWGAAASAGELTEADRLAASDRPEDLVRAASLYEAVLESDESAPARLGAAIALNKLMAIRTNGNLPLVDGLQDGPEHRAIWAELGPRSLAHARRALTLRPGTAEAAAALANAYMFHASSLGILKSILGGAAGEYREHATRLVEIDPAYDDGLGDYLLASFYLVAPWPIGDSEQALSHYQRAARLSPSSVRNQYGLGVYWARRDELARALSHFGHVRRWPCTEHTERLFCDWMKAEAERLIRAAGAP
jgi:tetratricopeptide (TPR) repeat protein